MSTNLAKPAKVAIIGASGTYGKRILARAEEIGVEAQLNEVEKLKEAFTGCDGVVSALGDDRKKRPMPGHPSTT